VLSPEESLAFLFKEINVPESIASRNKRKTEFFLAIEITATN
jgi:hypothetical protein